MVSLIDTNTGMRRHEMNAQVRYYVHFVWSWFKCSHSIGDVVWRPHEQHCILICLVSIINCLLTIIFYTWLLFLCQWPSFKDLHEPSVKLSEHLLKCLIISLLLLLTHEYICFLYHFIINFAADGDLFSKCWLVQIFWFVHSTDKTCSPIKVTFIVLEYTDPLSMLHFSMSCFSAHKLVEDFIARSYMVQRLISCYFNTNNVAWFQDMQRQTGAMLGFLLQEKLKSSHLELIVNHKNFSVVDSFLWSAGYNGGNLIGALKVMPPLSQYFCASTFFHLPMGLWASMSMLTNSYIKKNSSSSGATQSHQHYIAVSFQYVLRTSCCCLC